METQVRFTVGAVAPDIWQINEKGAGQDVDCYLVIGSERAVLIDSLMSRGDRRLYDIVREKTSLPVDVLHTHGHGDHVGAELKEFIDAGCDIYLSPKDLPLVGMFGASYSPDIFKPLEEGMTFDLGGRKLETIALPGHTPGSVLFLDRERRQMLSGDTVGSGHIWLQLDHSEPLHVFRDGVKCLEEEIADLRGLVIYPGHRSQSAVQLNGAYITHLRELCDMVLSGEMAGDENPMLAGRFPNARVVSYGLVQSLVYAINNL